jgi:predicted helicase
MGGVYRSGFLSTVSQTRVEIASAKSPSLIFIPTGMSPSICIDIVQAAGRALRRYRGKECGYIVVPLIVPAKMDFKEFAETTAFRQVAQTITALSTQDERIADEFRAIERGRISSGKIVEVGRANWRKFEDARAFVHGLGLKSASEWREYLSIRQETRRHSG